MKIKKRNKVIFLLFSLSFVVSFFLSGCFGIGVVGGTGNYTVRYDANGATSGTIPEEAKVYPDGLTVWVLDNTGNLEKEGYIYGGWNTAADGTGTSYVADESLHIDGENVTLYARWLNNSFYVTYEVNGADSGTGPVDSYAYQDEEEVVVLGNTGDLEKAGSVFAGWNTRADGLGFNYGPGSLTGIRGTDITFYAAWREPEALWGRSVVTGPGDSQFNGLAIGSDESLIAVGYQDGTYEYSYGPGVSAAGGNSYYANNTKKSSVIVKYSNDGTAQWAGAASNGTGTSQFHGVSCDSADAVYAVGYQSDTDAYFYDDSIWAAAHGYYDNAVIVKYGSDGTALWAQSVRGAYLGESVFYDVAVDASDNVYAVGGQEGAVSYNYGTVDNDISATGGSPENNAVIVKYDSNGTTLWARSASAGDERSVFYGICMDSSGNVYAVGEQGGITQNSYGDGVSVSGGDEWDVSILIVKYDADGNALWARSTESTPNTGGGSGFFAVSVDSQDNVYAAGYRNSSASVLNHQYLHQGNDFLLVKYSTAGTAQWELSESEALADSLMSPGSEFDDIQIDSSDNIYVVGLHDGDAISYGVEQTVPGNMTAHSVLAQYDSAGNALGVHDRRGGK